MQNQAYQQAAQADLANGANVGNFGKHSLAQVGEQQVDLSLLQGRQDLDGPISDEWLKRNVRVDRVVEFGSEEYFALAADPEVRPFLQGGRNVVFFYLGEVIAIQDGDHPPNEPEPDTVARMQIVAPDAGRSDPRAAVWAINLASELLGTPVWLAPLAGLAMLLGLANMAVVLGCIVKGSVK
jgi:hypothetical protein